MKNYELDAPNTNPEIGVFKIPDNSVMGHAAIEAAKTVANSEGDFLFIYTIEPGVTRITLDDF